MGTKKIILTLLDVKLWIGLLLGAMITIKHQVSVHENYLPSSSVQATLPVTDYQKILCWVVTHPANIFKAQMVQKTWGRKCDKLIFISSEDEPSLPTVVFPIKGKESRKQLWNKAKFTFQHVYDNYLNDYDWFFKADDDTYAILENMRSYVATLNSSLPLFLGRHFKTFVPGRKKVNYLTGGAGYLLTRESLRRLVERGLKKNQCGTRLPGNSDDVILGECMERLAAIFGDTRDSEGRQRFIQHLPENLYKPSGGSVNTIRKHDFYPVSTGYECCSNQLISFHYTSGYKAQFVEYLLYKLEIDRAQQKEREQSISNNLDFNFN